jgi:hypothetical protein
MNKTNANKNIYDVYCTMSKKSKYLGKEIWKKSEKK